MLRRKRSNSGVLIDKRQGEIHTWRRRRITASAACRAPLSFGTSNEHDERSRHVILSQDILLIEKKAHHQAATHCYQPLIHHTMFTSPFRSISVNVKTALAWRAAG
jgi:hypothetical protein